MNEQDISKAVEAVLGQMNGQHAHHGEGHVCRCNKNKMTLKLANALIEKVKAYAQEMGVNVVIAVSDQAGRPVAVQCTKPYTSPSKPQITEDGIPDVDLSAIRQQISEEVQRIYEDDQNS